MIKNKSKIIIVIKVIRKSYKFKIIQRFKKIKKICNNKKKIPK